jgi:hypothetical protein
LQKITYSKTDFKIITGEEPTDLSLQGKRDENYGDKVENRLHIAEGRMERE